ncbi:copper ABC transporter ATP-binding protein [Haladaptatus sp. R4]|uniref:ABC transporter ATP-binding protein n=1 Tax=Haladaptatus sp. R4 TaxID=1679489 RepID=UPI0007B45F3A|nr:ABC transporter ATP-binding protein [Haladaptatus sp. R4]KZN24835.1 copper ABC transporter ATP-binding protein [Haladaptatus sp. R4]
MNTNETAVIDVSNVTKQFGSVTALQELNLTVNDGEIYGFLGPNGSGKSTTINVLLDFIRPTSGQATLFGQDSHAHSHRIRERIGVLPDGFDVYDRLTGYQHIELTVESKRAADDPMSILERVGIEDAADRRAGTYSKGMTQRLVLGMALVGEPELIILDEPSTGLDPNGAREMREIILEENRRGATVFFSSHILSQVEAVCDRVGILSNGSLVAEDSIRNLRERMDATTQLTLVVSETTHRVLDAIRSCDGVESVTAEGDRIAVAIGNGSKADVIEAVESSGVELRDFSVVEASLEDLFAAYTEGQEVIA